MAEVWVGEGDLVDDHAAAGVVGGRRVPGRAEPRVQGPRRTDLDGGRELGDQLTLTGLRGGDAARVVAGCAATALSSAHSSRCVRGTARSRAYR